MFRPVRGVNVDGDSGHYEQDSRKRSGQPHRALSTGREYLAEVVRVDTLINGMNGVGFKLLMEMGQQGSWNDYGSAMQRK